MASKFIAGAHDHGHYNHHTWVHPSYRWPGLPSHETSNCDGFCLGRLVKIVGSMIGLFLGGYPNLQVGELELTSH